MQMRAAKAVITVATAAAVVATTGAMAVASTTSRQLTGSRLAAALLPASAFPRGYALTGTHDSGPRLETGPARYHPTLQSCTQFARTFGRPGYGETAIASGGYATLFGGGFGGGSEQSFRQAVYQFGSAKAARSFFAGLHGAANRCPAWLLTAPPGTTMVSSLTTFAVTTADGQEFQVSASASDGQGHTADDSAVIVLNGQDVFEVDALAGNRPLPATPALDGLMHQLVVRVHAAR